MQPLSLEILNAAVRGATAALTQVAPEPAPRPVRLWVRENPSTVLPVVLTFRLRGRLQARVHVGLDLATALELADRTLREEGGFAAGFSTKEQEAIRRIFGNIPKAILNASGQGQALVADSPRLLFGQRVPTRAAFCATPLTVGIWSEAGTLELDIAMSTLAADGLTLPGAHTEERHGLDVPCLQD